MNRRPTISLFLLISALAALAWGLGRFAGDGSSLPSGEAAAREVAETIQRGNAAYESGRKAEALAAWGSVARRSPRTGAWGVATFNTALCLREQGRPREAITLLERLLESELNDHDPSGYLMEMHQNYHHRACLAISSCYESLGDLRSAIRYAVLARDRYRYYTGCGNCMIYARHELAEKIARLEKVAGGN